MFSEIFVSSLMQIAITGAGLVFAVYALVAALHRQMLQRRAQDLYEKVEEYKKRTDAIPPKEQGKQQLKELEADIRLTNVFPWYFGIGIGIAFLLYMVCVFAASIWFVSSANRTGEAEFVIWQSFMLGNLAFLIVGFMIILEISRTLKKTYEKTKVKLMGPVNRQIRYDPGVRYFRFLNSIVPSWLQTKSKPVSISFFASSTLPATAEQYSSPSNFTS